MQPSGNANNIYSMYGVPSNGYQQQQPQYAFMANTPQNFQHVGFNQFPARMPGTATGYSSGQSNFYPVQPQHQARMNNALPVPDAGSMTRQKQEMYKMEQQRKFKNMGKSFKHTSIDSMLDSIVSSTTKLPRTAAVQSSQTTVEDDFGDFLQAPVGSVSANLDPTPDLGNGSASFSSGKSQDPSPSLPSIDMNGAGTSLNQAETTHSKENNLQAKMLASLDLNAPQKAHLRFTPTHVEKSRKYEKSYQSSTKAANWSALVMDQTEFHIEDPVPALSKPEVASDVKPTRATSWLDDPVQIPLVYKQVFEACVSGDGMVDTSRVYPILLQSQLSNETLGHLWSVANKAIPGRLNQRELHTLLALIALAQSGVHNTSVGDVIALPAAPIPQLLQQGTVQTSVSPPEPTVAPPTTGVPPLATPSDLPSSHTHDDEFDDFQEFQSVPAERVASVTSIDGAYSKPHISPSATSIKLDAFSVSATPTVATPIPSSSKSGSSTADHVMQSAYVAESNHVTMPTLQASAAPSASGMLGDEDKYAAFKDSTIMSLFDTALSPPDVEQPTAVEQPDALEAAASNIEQTSAYHPNIEPPSYQSLFNSSTADSVPSDPLQSGTFPAEWVAFSGNTHVQDESLTAKDVLFSGLQFGSKDSENGAFGAQSSLPSASVGAPKALDDLFNAFESSVSIAPTNTGKDAFTVPVLTLDSDVAGNAMTTEVPNDIAMTTEVPDSAMATDVPGVVKPDRFAALKMSSPFKTDVLSIKSDSNSVKSLELGRPSPAVFTQSPSTGMAASEFTETKPTMPGGLGAEFNYGYEPDDDYANFVESPPALPDNYDDEFDAFQEGTSTLTNFDAFEDVDEGRFKNNRKQPEQKDKFDFRTDPVPINVDEDVDVNEQTADVREDHVPSIDETKLTNFHMHMSSNGDVVNRNTVDISSSDSVAGKVDPVVEETEPPPFFNENIATTESDLEVEAEKSDRLQLFCDHWERCLSTCYDIIVKTNEILNGIQSQVLCSEVVNSCKGNRFIADLTEVYGVACKIRQSARTMKIQNESLQHLHKQIELAWNNLLAFCPNAPTVSEQHSDTETEAAMCDVCLLPVTEYPITYGGATYHAACANLWINCVAPVLPVIPRRNAR